MNNCMEIASMATTILSQTHPKFTDVYWIIPLDSAVPLQQSVIHSPRFPHLHRPIQRQPPYLGRS
nr:hypothetical protein [Arsenophonus endosymbiont of Aleurodicus floccissimus]